MLLQHKLPFVPITLDAAGALDWFRRSTWVPIVATLAVAHVLLLGQFLLTPGMPRGGDMAVNMVNGYVAENSTWHELWDDTRFPSQSKHVSRYAFSDLALATVTKVSGDLFFSIRFMVWLFHIVAMVGMYLFVSRITGSRLAGALAALVIVFSRGAPLRAIMAMMAGFALIPLVFFAVDRFLHDPTWCKALLVTIVLALYTASAIPPFTYILGLALLVYVGAFAFSKIGEAIRGQNVVPALTRVGGFGVLALVVTVPLAAYYLAALMLSTAPLIQDAGGYDLDALATGTPTFREALMFYRGEPSLNTPQMDVAIWLLAIGALMTPLLRVNFRVAALVVIALGGLYFASDVTSPIYTFMYDHVPFFSSVRGTRRWTAFTLFGFAALVGIGVSAGIDRWRGRKPDASLWERLIAQGSGFAVVALVLVVAFNVLSQLPALKEWLAPYTLSDDYVAPYVWLRDSTPEGTVYATSPFLTKRLKNDAYDLGMAHGKKAGPGISGRPAFGVFQSGGKKVNSSMFEMVSDMKGFPTRLFEGLALSETPVSLVDRANRGPRSVRNFVISGTLLVSDVDGPDSRVRLRFQELKGEGGVIGYHFLDYFPESGDLILQREFGEVAQRVGSTDVSPGLTTLDIDVFMIGDDFIAAVNGEEALKAYIPEYTGGNITIEAHGMNATFSELEASIVNGDVNPDYALPGILGLFNVQYFVVQPNTTSFERQAIDALPGLHLMGSWGGSSLYLNEYYQPGKAYVTSEYGVYLGGAVNVTHGLYGLSPVAQAKMPLIAISDLPADRREELFAGAAFVAVDGGGEIEPAQSEMLASILNTVVESGGSPPPLVYSWDLSPDETVVDILDATAPVFDFDAEPVIVGRGKNFVLETTIMPEESTGVIPETLMQFRYRNEERYYQIVLSPEENLATLELYRPKNVVTVQEAPVEMTGDEEMGVRLAAVDDKIQLYLNGDLVLDVTDSRIDKGGSINVLSPDGSGRLTAPNLVAGGGSFDPGDEVVEYGLGLGSLVHRINTLSDANIASLGFRQFYSTEFAPEVGAGYRLVVTGVTTEDSPGFDAAVSAFDGTLGFEVNPALANIDSWIQPKAGVRWMAVSEPFWPDAATMDIAVASSSNDTLFHHMMLVREDGDGSSEAVLAAMMDAPPSDALMIERESATRYTGNLPAGGGVLVFQDTFNNGWRGRLDGELLPHFPAFGNLNAYWVEAEAAQLGGDLMLNFAPQQRYRQAQFLSAATFGLILVAFAAPVGWRRFGGNRLLDSVRERLAGSERLTRWLPKRKSDSGARRLV